jgi:hypothetical protein
MSERSVKCWAGLWRSHNQVDGYREHVLYEDCLPKLFRTRADCRAFIQERYGYIAERPDLRREPHGWRMPIPVRVSLSVSTCREQGLEKEGDR